MIRRLTPAVALAILLLTGAAFMPAIAAAQTPGWHQLSGGFDGPSGDFPAVWVYDAASDRAVAVEGFRGYGGGRTWQLPRGDAGAWAPLSASSPAVDGDTGYAFDQATRRAFVYGGGELWQLSLADESSTMLFSLWLPYSFVRPGRRSGALVTLAPPLAALDPQHPTLLVFGGRAADGAPLHELWTFHVDGDQRWHYVPLDAPPPARSGACGIFDPVRSRLVLFGGTADGATALGDTWVLDFSRVHYPQRVPGAAGMRHPPERPRERPLEPRSLVATWNRLDTPGPPPRAGACAVYDSLRDRMVIFGGWSASGQGLNDTWALSLADGSWTRLDVASPPPAIGIEQRPYLATHDPTRDRVLVYGIDHYGNAGGRVWELSLASPSVWNELTIPRSPPARVLATAIVRANHHMVLLGGAGFGDTWDWDLSADSVWTPLDIMGPVTLGGRTPRFTIRGAIASSPSARLRTATRSVYGRCRSTAHPHGVHFGQPGRRRRARAPSRSTIRSAIACSSTAQGRLAISINSR